MVPGLLALIGRRGTTTEKSLGNAMASTCLAVTFGIMLYEVAVRRMLRGSGSRRASGGVSAARREPGTSPSSQSPQNGGTARADLYDTQPRKGWVPVDLVACAHKACKPALQSVLLMCKLACANCHLRSCADDQPMASKAAVRAEYSAAARASVHVV